MHDQMTTTPATAALQAPDKRSGNQPGGGESDDEYRKRMQEDHCCGCAPGKYELLWLVCLPCLLCAAVAAGAVYAWWTR